MRLRILREAAGFDPSTQVDRAAAVIRGVRVISANSRNQRRYTDSALDAAVPLYEGARVYVDHPAGESNARQFRERFGRLTNARRDAGGVRADLKYNPRHPDAETLLWYAENDPGEIGLSHNAEGNGRRLDDGVVLVEKITRVYSVDLVDGPATTMSLYEQEEDMDPLTDPAAAAAAPAATAPAGGDDFSSKLADLAREVAAHPEWDKPTKISKLKALINLMEDDAGAAAEPAPEPADDDEMLEQLGKFRHPAVRRARRQLLRERHKTEAVRRGVPAAAVTEVFLEQLAAAKPADVVRLIDDRRALAAAKPAAAPPAPTGGATVDPKKLAAELFGD